METKLEEGIKELTSKAKDANTALDAMQFAQAALNLMQAFGVLREANRKK